MNRKKTCEKCESKNLKSHLTTYPLKVENKQLNVERVPVKECLDCHHLMPTLAGHKKVMRSMMAFMTLLLQD